ncbi:MAG: AAA family ATPase [Candidatus Dormibacteraeota bacterium]|nr:AAA family ATPase [Candidatus Dormibacteraeota bacterium]
MEPEPDPPAAPGQETLGSDPQAMEVSSANTITVLSARGGSGKTFLATNLGVALARRRGETAVLVDLNLEFGGVALALNIRHGATMLEAAHAVERGISDLDLDATLALHSSGLRLVSAMRQPGDSELLADGAMSGVIERLRQIYDYVILDARPSFRGYMLDLWESSDTMLVTCTPDVPAVILTSLLLDAFRMVNLSREEVVVVLNEVYPKTMPTASQVQKSLDVKVHRVPYGGQQVTRAVDLGQVLVEVLPKHVTSLAIFKLAEFLATRRRRTDAAVSVR